MEEKSIRDNRKYYQRNKILDIVRNNKNVSRFKIKKRTSYSMTTVLNTVEELINEGYLIEEDCEENRVGRRPIWLHLNPKKGIFIGVEFNGLEMHCDVLDFIGKIVYKAKTKMDYQDSKEVIVGKICLNIDAAIKNCETISSTVFGIGIGVPGYINKQEGIGVSYSYFKDWKNIPIKKIVEDKYKLPCYINNNVNVMALAYKNLNFCENCKDFVFMSIRTGIRIVPVINNKMIFSNSGFSGELGHVKIGSNHNICTCGQFGCLNSEISNIAIISKIKDGLKIGRFEGLRNIIEGDINNLSLSTFAKAVERGCHDSVSLMNNIAYSLGEAIALVLNILAPSKIIIFGEIMELGNPFINKIYSNLKNIVIEENLVNFEILPSKLGADIGAIGAASLVMSESFCFIEQTV